MPKTSLEEAQNNKGNTEGLMTLTSTQLFRPMEKIKMTNVCGKGS